MKNRDYNDIINSIEAIKTKYKNFEKFLPKNYYSKLTEEYLKYDFSKAGIVSGIMMTIENKVQYDLCKIAINNMNKNDIDLLTLLMENYKTPVRIILKKIEPSLASDKVFIEELIEESINNYDGSKLFSIHALETVKNKLSHIKTK